MNWKPSAEWTFTLERFLEKTRRKRRNLKVEDITREEDMMNQPTNYVVLKEPEPILTNVSTN